MQHGDAWFLARTTTRLQRRSSERITTLATRLATGTLADGSPAVVHRIDLRYQESCEFVPDCHGMARRHEQYVMVCSLPRDDDLEGGVVCGSVEYVCPRGCKGVTLRDGVLHARERDGAVQFVVVR
jgi:hypothetical protein